MIVAKSLFPYTVRKEIPRPLFNEATLAQTPRLASESLSSGKFPEFQLCLTFYFGSPFASPNLLPHLLLCLTFRFVSPFPALANCAGQRLMPPFHSGPLVWWQNLVPPFGGRISFLTVPQERPSEFKLRDLFRSLVRTP